MSSWKRPEHRRGAALPLTDDIPGPIVKLTLFRPRLFPKASWRQKVAQFALPSSSTPTMRPLRSPVGSLRKSPKSGKSVCAVLDHRLGDFLMERLGTNLGISSPLANRITTAPLGTAIMVLLTRMIGGEAD
jgi:hypothetical protein